MGLSRATRAKAQFTPVAVAGCVAVAGRVALVALAASTGACSGLEARDPGDGGSGSAFAGGAGADATAPSLAVSASASSSVVCAGECVDLSAQATGGVGPYAYSWNNAPSASGSGLHVCPGVTTTYAVEATDSSGSGGEFAKAGAKGTATVTVSVSPSCDGGALGEGGSTGADAGPASSPSGLGRALCEVEWPLGGSANSVPTGFAGRFNLANVTTDAAGNIFVVGTHSGTATVGGASFAAGSDNDALLVKLDSQCHVLWAKEFGGLFASAIADSIGIDGASNIFIGGALAGTVDFGTGAINGASPNAALVVKLDPNGNALWAKAFPSQASLGSAIEDLALDPSGEPLLIATGGTDLNFGNGPVGGSSANDTSFLVKLGSDGHEIFARPPSSYGANGAPTDFWRVATNATGNIWVGALGVDATGMKTTDPVLALDADGGVVYSQVVEGPPAAPSWNGVAIQVDDASQVAVFSSWYGAPDAGYMDGIRMLTQLTASGAPLSTSTADYLSHFAFSFDGSHFLGMTPGGNAVVGSAFEGTIDLGALGMLTTSANVENVDVTVMDSAGNLRAAAQWVDDVNDLPTDMTVDAQGNVVFVGSRSNGSALDLFVVKLGW